MTTILTIFLACLLLLPVSAFAEIQTITHTVKQPFGGSQSPDDARISAVAKAKREALEMAGTYIESLTVVKNYQVDKDEILALSAGVLKAEVVSQKNYHTDDAFGIDVVVKVVVDTSVLEGRVKKLLQDRAHLEQLNQARKMEKELLDKIAILEKENRLLMAKKESSKDLKKQFETASQELTAVEWHKKYWDLKLDSTKGEGTVYPVEVAKKGIEYLSYAIRLKPDFAEALHDRALNYAWLDQDEKALDDFNEVIRLKPDDADAYSGRGTAYQGLGQNDKAIVDYNTAIRLTSDKDWIRKPGLYLSRGYVYGALGQSKKAIDDYNEAIRLTPDFARAYSYRAQAYNKLGLYEKAIEDCNKAIQLNPEYSFTWFFLGAAYNGLKLYDGAIKAYREAARINPEDAAAWYNLGNAYYNLERFNDAIAAYHQSIRIDPRDADTWHNLGRAHFLSGNRIAALDAVRELRRLDPTEADKLFNLIVPR